MAASLFFTVLLALPGLAGAQGFGQNHVRLERFDWKVRSTAHFDIHYYDRSEPFVDKAALYLETAFEEGARRLDHPIEERKPFFLFASVNDMQQTNIARVGDGVGGVTEAFKDRFMVYADGSEAWLENVIVHEYGHIVEFDILMAGFWRSARVLKTFIYPLWMMEGTAEYLTGHRDSLIEDVYLRDAALHDGLIPLTRLMQFGHLKPHQVTLAYKSGASAVRFLADEYGREKPGELLNTFTSKFDINSVLLEVVGLDLATFSWKWREYITLKYERQKRLERLEPPAHWGDAFAEYDGRIPAFDTSPAFTPDGSKMAFLSTREGFPALPYVRDLARGEDRRLIGREFERLENIPLGSFTQVGRNLALSPDGASAVFSGQKNHREYFYFIDVERGTLRRRAPEGFEQLFQPAFSPDGKSLVFSGLREGRTDLWLWDLESEDLTRLTDDPNDDRSPAFAPDGNSVVFSTEFTDRKRAEPHQRDLRRVWLADKRVEVLTTLRGNEREPVFDAAGEKILFVGEEGGVPDLYELELASGRVTRLTRSTGGAFTPAYAPNGDLVFAGMYQGSVRLYRGARARFLDEEVVPGKKPEMEDDPVEASPVLSKVRDYRFRAGTDLFLPAFFYSSQGGLFWTSYWQASDYLGDHRLSNTIVYNSGSSFLNYNVDYVYAKHRPELILRAQGFTTRDNLNIDGYRFDQDAHFGFVGVGYPFDRFHRAEVLVGGGNNAFRYPNANQPDFTDHVRMLQASFVRDTVGGRYLVATYGSRFRFTHSQAYDVLGGNQNFSTEILEGHRFFPVAEQSAVAVRGLAAASFGADQEVFELGGIGWTRGFQRSAIDNIGTRFVLGTLEYRFPVWRDLDYYMNFMFPDFYFKSVRGAVFTDASLRWNNENELRGSTAGDVLHSVGVGLRVHTFILQAFPLVLSMDYAWKTNNGGRVMYFYLGPVF